MPWDLYFRYGAMSSSKSANLLMTAHNYQLQEKKIILMKPSLDTRSGTNLITSRVGGLEKKADIIVQPDTKLLSYSYDSVTCVLVDEANLLTSSQIDELRCLTRFCPVICYGLRTDYSGHLFEGSRRLMELADCIEEVRTICFFCSQKATMTLKYSPNGMIIKSGQDQIDIGGDDKYLPCCWHCWDQKLFV